VNVSAGKNGSVIARLYTVDVFACHAITSRTEQGNGIPADVYVCLYKRRDKKQIGKQLRYMIRSKSRKTNDQNSRREDETKMLMP
jgi:hypothetical protein